MRRMLLALPPHTDRVPDRTRTGMVITFHVLPLCQGSPYDGIGLVDKLPFSLCPVSRHDPLITMPNITLHHAPKAKKTSFFNKDQRQGKKYSIPLCYSFVSSSTLTSQA